MVDPISTINTAISTTNTRAALDAVERSSARLSSAGPVDRSSAEITDYLEQKALLERLGELAENRTSLQIEQSQYTALSDGLYSIEQATRLLNDLSYEAKLADPAERADYIAQFNEIRDQIDSLANDAYFLAQYSADDFSASSLGIGDVATDYNNFATDGDIDAAIRDLSAATSTLRERQSDLSVDIAVSNVREGFTQSISNTIQTGADELVNADLTEEAAIQLAAQVRSDLSFQGQKIMNQSESLLLGLFG